MLKRRRLSYKIIWSAYMDDFRRPRTPQARPTRSAGMVNGGANMPVGQPGVAPQDQSRPIAQQESAPTTGSASSATPVQQESPISNQPVNATAMPSFAPAPIIDTEPPKKRPSVLKRILIALGVLVGIGLVIIGATLTWYFMQLQPVDASDTTLKELSIESGQTPTSIANELEAEGLVKSSTAFLWYTRLNGIQNQLQAGIYRISPSESTPDVAAHLTSGSDDMFTVTFLPGATLAENREVLIDAGFGPNEVDLALAADYESPLFEGKPADADLEGYIYGESYTFGSGATVEEVLNYTFAEFYKVVEANQLVDAFAAQGLSLYEGITLSSIVQREAGPHIDDMAQIAQVFYTRLAIGMQLGSDVTYQYIADKLGVPRSTDIDSPYNTRKYTGLPPGPIATAGESALIATANPAEGDYIYFLSGDDDVTYFARTLDQHESNIVNHCQVKCSTL